MPFIQMILSLLAGVGGQFGVQKLLGFGAKSLGSAALKKAGVAAGSEAAKKIVPGALQRIIGSKGVQSGAGLAGFFGVSSAVDELLNSSEPRDVAPEPDVHDIFNVRRGPDENIAGLQRIMSQAELRSVLESLGVSEQDFIGTSLGGFL